MYMAEKSQALTLAKNHLADHVREQRSPGSQLGDRDHDLGSPRACFMIGTVSQ